MDAHPKIVIVGAGISGLSAAMELERNGLTSTIFEKSDRPGGRVKTDLIDGWQLDHGFQVLLTAYPENKNFLDLDALNLKLFDPGAEISIDGKITTLSDPLRKPSETLNSVFSTAATLRDKWKIFQLRNHLQGMSVEEIFSSTNESTLDYLQKYGFSDRVIDQFFRPFFSGIFLEPNLETSSRLFKFIFKMFGEGHAAIPASGMQAIPDQMAAKIKSKIQFHSEYASHKDHELQLSNGEKVDYDYLIMAYDPGIKKENSKKYKGTVNVYFSIPKTKGKAIIRLFPEEDKLINNACIISNVSGSYSSSNRSLLSVSTTGIPSMSEDQLIPDVKKEVAELYGINESEITHIRSYFIPYSLPDISKPTMGSEIEFDTQENVLFAGDYLMAGSLNAAMISGKKAALKIVKALN